MIKILTTREEWCAAVNLAAHSDFYHTFEYHQLSKNAGETPVLIVYQQGRQSVLLPLIIREIPGSRLKDATSVYGYPGPIGINLEAGMDYSGFREALVRLFREMGIVTVFSRLNPFIPFQTEILKGMGEISSPGKVVYIDLAKGLDQQWSGYNRRLRTYINKSRREYTIINAHTKEDIQTFVELYYRNMDRVNAQKMYYFEAGYFEKLLGSRNFESEILLAKRKSNSEIAGGALFIKKKPIIQYHLSGARDNALDLNPIKLLIDEMRIRATHDGYRFYNLGGGLGNKEDSLFHFKASFSKDFRNFNLWKFIVDQEQYDRLVEEFRAGVCPKLSSQCRDFFPCYRCDNWK